MAETFPDMTHIRHIMLYELKRGSNATIATKNINDTYGEVLDVRTCQNWFKRFRNDDISLESKPKGHRPSVVDNDLLKTIVEEDPRQTLEELSIRLQCSITTVWAHMQEIGKTNRCGVWIPHELRPEHKSNRIQICNSLLIRHNRVPFYKCIVTGDEKWVLYENPQKKNQWLSPGETPVPVPKPGLHPKKILLTVFWDYQGIIHFEFLEMGQTITAEFYCQVLDRLRDALIVKRPALINRNKIIFHHDGAKPHTAKVTQQKLREFGWEVMLQPPYSPDISPSDYYLFLSMQHFLSGKKFSQRGDIEIAISQFFSDKPSSWYSQGIKKLVERWEEVVNRDGDYIID
jgi:histone-lysine N-methyltransferase SETMAR